MSDQGQYTERAIDANTKKLITRCRKMLSDGELSGDEVWSLANWMNKNPECTKSWPGEVLAPALKAVFEDGIIEIEELEHLALLLLDIERQWSLHQTAVQQEQKLASREEAVAERVVVRVPRFAHRCSVESFSSDDSYDVDLDWQSCPCPDWIDRRRGFALESPDRCCKHIVRAIFDNELDDQLDPLPRSILENCYERSRGADMGAEYFLLSYKDNKALLSVTESDWINVYALGGDGCFERFGYNRLERRWAYGESPYGIATAVRKFARELNGS